MQQMESSHVGAHVERTCPVCRAADSEPRTQHRETSHGGQTALYTLRECGGCGVQFWTPRARPDASYYESEAISIYRDMHAGNPEASSDPRYGRFLQDFGNRRGIKLLDVGCGSGALLDAVRALGNQVWGVDYDSRSVALARARGLENVTCETLEDFVARERDLRFDVISAFDVIEHLAEPVAVLEQLRELLAPGGQLIVTVPNRHRLLVNQILSDFPPHHFFRFDRGSVERLLNQAGFDDARASVFQYGYAGPVALATALRPVRKFMKDKRASSSAQADDHSAPRAATARKKRVVEVLSDATLPLSCALERALGRGFKVYATARKPAAQQSAQA